MARGPGPVRVGFGVSAVAGLLLLGAVAVWAVARTAPPTDAGQVPSATADAQLPSGPDSRARPDPSYSGPSRRSAPARSAPADSVPVGSEGPRSGPNRSGLARSETRATTARSASSPPSILDLPTLSVTASVRPVEAVDGILQVPDDPAEVGWWTGSAQVGSPIGTIVIDGHIDSASRGVGALFRLGELDPGDEVVVRGGSGASVRYLVQARRIHEKTAALPAEIFATTGPPRLVLISCGGTFDEQARSYRENIVVYATPAG